MSIHLEKLRLFLQEKQLDGVIISKSANVRYFSGFTGTAGILICTQDKGLLITDSRYIEQAKKQAVDFEIIKQGKNIINSISDEIQSLTILRLGFESDFLTWDLHTEIAEKLINQELVPIKLDSLRMIKNDTELAYIKAAVDIADQAFEYILDYLRPGVSEFDIAAELEYKMRKLGAQKPAFDTIVASGARSALPHGIAAAKRIESGDIVTMDFGAVYEGYHSDITRSVVIGQATSKQREVYEIVLAAQLAALDSLNPGRTGAEIDAIARDQITLAGYGEFFGHGLGHGLGLSIHEEPRLSPSGCVVLQPGMVVTVEPGIYLPDWGGVRIEDTVVISAYGCQVLTSSDKQLIEINV